MKSSIANSYLTHLSEEFQVGDTKVSQFKTTELSIYSYLLQSNGEAVLIDPVFDVENYVKEIKDSGCHLKHIMLTHHHSDFIAGHMEFPNVPIVMAESAKRPGMGFEYHILKEPLKLGNVKLQAVPTPGHTIESTTFIVLGIDDT